MTDQMGSINLPNQKLEPTCSKQLEDHIKVLKTLAQIHELTNVDGDIEYKVEIQDHTKKV